MHVLTDLYLLRWQAQTAHAQELAALQHAADQAQQVGVASLAADTQGVYYCVTNLPSVSYPQRLHTDRQHYVS